MGGGGARKHKASEALGDHPRLAPGAGGHIARPADCRTDSRRPLFGGRSHVDVIFASMVSGNSSLARLLPLRLLFQ
jgi:hypothetical protein